MSQYAKLDALILDRIGRANGATFTELQSNKAIADEAWNLATYLDRVDWRIIDARLQALRKLGLIRFVRPAWRLSERVRKEA